MIKGLPVAFTDGLKVVYEVLLHPIAFIETQTTPK